MSQLPRVPDLEAQREAMKKLRLADNPPRTPSFTSHNPVLASEARTSRNVTADAESRYDRTPRRLHHRIVVRKNGGKVAKGTGWNPLRHGIGQVFFRVRTWSINRDTGSGRCSFDLLYGGSDADEIEEGRPEFDSEVTFVGFAVGGDRIRFVDGEDV